MAVTIQLQASALTSLSRVLLELGLTPDNDKQDSKLNAYINSVSAWIATHCGRRFHRQDGIVEKVAGQGGVRIRLSRAPILDVTTVLVGGSEVDDFEVEDEDARVGLLYRESGWPWVTLGAGGLDQGPRPGEEKKNITVTYDGGYVTRAQAAAGGDFEDEEVTLPAELEDACVELVIARHRAQGNDPRVISETHENRAYTFTAGPMPASVQAKLAAYARIAHA